MTASTQPIDSLGWNLESTYCGLPEQLFEVVQPATFAAPTVSIVNHRLAGELGLSLEDCSDEALAQLFSGQSLPQHAASIAQAYAGHQFGGFTMLGDGRAILLGEQRSPDGKLFDIQFKGSGETPYSRRGDGKAALGPMLREYIISEAMVGLGIPTTRSLAVIETGETVYRETMLKGAVLTRVAASHVRVGTFQFLAARKDHTALNALADYTIERHYPALAGESGATKYLRFLEAVIDRQAFLVAKWQSVGFIHGVMNTDNVSICGETIDYGPCAFMDTYHPATVFSSIDSGGRYAYRNQPPIALWNLARFAETLIPLIDEDQDKAIELATELLNTYTETFDNHWLGNMRAKLGLSNVESSDESLVNSLLSWMEKHQRDFTNTFDDLTCQRTSGSEYDDAEFRDWESQWQARLARDSNSQELSQHLMNNTNPHVIPRNHRVEEALSAATAESDLTPLHRLLAVLEDPFARSGSSSEFRTPPAPGTCYRTFCGT